MKRWYRAANAHFERGLFALRAFDAAIRAALVGRPRLGARGAANTPRPLDLP